MDSKSKRRVTAGLILLILIPIGFYTKFYHGFGDEWVQNKLGGIFYEIFWCLITYIVFNDLRPFKISLLVFVLTSLLEFTQLFNNSFLELLRSNFIGRTILGNSFAWTDFPYYIVGSACGYYVLIMLNRIK